MPVSSKIISRIHQYRDSKKKKNLLKKIQVLSEHMELGKNSPLLTIVPDG